MYATSTVGTPRPVRATLVALVALLLALTGLVMRPATAVAADVNVVDTDSIKISEYAGDNQLSLWWQAQIDLDWDTTGKDVRAGDTFTVELPDLFQPQSETEFALSLADGSSAGDCVVTRAGGGNPARIVCTFNDYVESHDGVKGSVWFRAQAVKTTTATSVDLVVNGTPVVVPLPGGGGITDAGPGAPPSNPKKNGWWGSQNSLINWYVHIWVPEGTTTLDFTDTFSGGQTYQDGSFTVHEMPHTDRDWAEENWTTVDPSRINVEVSGRTISGTVTGVDSSKLYEIHYITTIDNPAELAVGDTFTNKFIAAGQTLKGVTTKSQSGGGNAEGTGRGGIAVSKALTGAGAGSVPVDTEFTVRADYTVDGKPVQKLLTLTAGGEARVLDNLPQGTIVTLSEVTLPEIGSVEWGDPFFAAAVENPAIEVAEDGKSVRVTVAEDRNLRVLLTNTAMPGSTPTPTPETPTPTPTETPTESPTPTPTPTPTISETPTGSPTPTPTAGPCEPSPTGTPAPGGTPTPTGPGCDATTVPPTTVPESPAPQPGPGPDGPSDRPSMLPSTGAEGGAGGVAAAALLIVCGAVLLRNRR